MDYIMKKLPKYVKVNSQKRNGEPCIEWVVRLYDFSIENENGEKIDTPYHMLNRYYTTLQDPKNFQSVVESRKNKENLWITYEELNPLFEY